MMFFNPLFLQVINSQESLSASKPQKLNGSSYLFSDIIKVCIDKSESEGSGTGVEALNENSDGESLISSSPLNKFPAGSNIINTLNQGKSAKVTGTDEETLLNLLQEILPQETLSQKFNLTGPEENQSLAGSVSEKNNDNGALMLNENEVTSLISRLIENNYQGKINILSTGGKVDNENFKTIEIHSDNKYSPKDLLDLLKDGKAISLENPDNENSQGLLISLVEILNQNTPLSNGSEIKEKNTSVKVIPGSISADSSDLVTDKQIKTEDKTKLISSTDPKSLIEPEANIESSKPIYQVELSFFDSNNSNIQFAFNNFSSPNTHELQEMVNSKNIMQAENYSLNNIVQNSDKAIIQPDNNGLSLAEVKQQPEVSAGDYKNSANNKNTQTAGIAAENINAEVLTNLTKPVDNIQPAAPAKISSVSSKLSTTKDLNIQGNFINTIKMTASLGSEVLNEAKNYKEAKVTEESKNYQEAKVTQQFQGAQESIGIQNSKATQETIIPPNPKLVPDIKVPQQAKILQDQQNIKLQNNGSGKEIFNKDELTKSKVPVSDQTTAQNVEINKADDMVSNNESKTAVSELKADDPENIENEITKSSTKAAGVKIPDPKAGEEFRFLQNKKSNIIKDITLSIKTGKLQKEDLEKSNETTDLLQGKQANKTENPGLKHSVNPKESDINYQAADLKGNDNKISEKAYAKLAMDLGNSVKEKEIKIINVDKQANNNEAEPVNSPDKNTLSKDSGNSSEKESGHLAQDQQQVQDKTDVKARPQENQIAGNDFNRNVENAIKERTPLDANNLSNPVRTVKAAEMMKEISRFIEQNSSHTLTLKIDPENLGTVKIALDVVDKLVHASIEVENDAAKKMVETHLNQLYNSLSQNGVQLSSLNISLANYDQKQSKGFSPKRKVFHSSEEADYDENNVSEGRKMGYNTYEYLI